MNKFIIIICSLLLATSLYGQVSPQGSPTTVDAASLRQEIERLKQDSITLRENQNRLITQRIELERRREILTGGTERNGKQWKEDYGRICDALLAHEGLMLRHIVRFPLERRYNAQRVKEARQALDSLNALGFNESHYRDIHSKYLTLLNHYETYNSQLINHLQERIREIESGQQNGGSFFAISYKNWSKRLESLEYYSYYMDRQRSPSIPFLDERIDEYLSLLSKNPTDAPAIKAEIRRIVNELTGKASTN